MLYMYQDYQTLQLKSIDDKLQYNNEFIINNDLSDEKPNKILDVIEETDHNLDNGTWIDCYPIHLLEVNTIMSRLQNNGRGVDWSNYEHTIFQMLQKLSSTLTSVS